MKHRCTLKGSWDVDTVSPDQCAQIAQKKLGHEKGEDQKNLHFIFNC